MNIMTRFLISEIASQGMYDEIMKFINSFHIRSGEFEGNEYIIKKMDQANYIIFSEYIHEDGYREICGAASIDKDALVREINKYAQKKDMDLG